ncbi:hypothetical protein [Streptomyces spectabilis]|uniref:Lipoprotein n=1 Tax=Streptomyces spectabilis TaxID=68270 RepID=A0A516RAT0_STRST|nr:hypothetical protein [Streptomyces spectabilis]QDQ12769.1 hypothetical protein FH965_21185 [Streptomyces spectabilis]
MRRTTIALLAPCLLLATATIGCSNSDGAAKDCATALTGRTGSDSADTPTVSEAEKRVDALDKTFAGMVRSGYADAAKNAADAVKKKTKEGGKSRPEACEPLSEDDYTALLMAEAIGGLGWTDKDGRFDKLKMVESLGWRCVFV